ncbi:MAG: Hybrid sensor histidine kinase [Bryobacterales bacterium]|nr:Hybrid sensor histidine kinase [Bryobacterales bacterium]
MARILLVEDELLIAEDLTHKIRRLGHAVVGHAATGEGAVQQAAETRPDVVLMDVRLRGGMNGVEAARLICKVQAVAVVYVTANANFVAASCDEQQRQFILTKPFTIAQLESVIAKACRPG